MYGHTSISPNEKWTQSAKNRLCPRKKFDSFVTKTKENYSAISENSAPEAKS